jgi:hypothetical protein
MTTATATTTTVSFAKLADGSWGIQGYDLVSGQTVTVVKRSGETSQAVVGEVVDFRYGKVFATIARAPRPAAADPVTEIGFYLHDGDVFKVVLGKTSRKPYASKVTKNGFEYNSGAIFTLSASELMTAEEVRIYSRTIGICANCSVELSDPVSVEIGLGTHCGPSILGSDSYKAARKAAKLVPHVAEALAKIAAEKKAAKAMVEAAKAADKADEVADEVADLLAHFGA